MVILKLNTKEIAEKIAYMLQGKQIGRYVILAKRDQPAINLAIALTEGKILSQSYPGIVMLLALMIFTCQGLLWLGFWADSLTRALEAEVTKVK